MKARPLILIGAVVAVAGCSAVGQQPQVSTESLIASPAAVEARRAALQTLASGEAEPWSDPATGARGSVTVVQTYRGPNGRWCRLIDETIEPRNGSAVSNRALYCRNASGQWTLAAAG